MCPCGCCGSNDDYEEERQTPKVVMAPCKYCGTLFAQSASFCPNCGARRTA